MELGNNIIVEIEVPRVRLIEIDYLWLYPCIEPNSQTHNVAQTFELNILTSNADDYCIPWNRYSSPLGRQLQLLSFDDYYQVDNLRMYCKEL